jgi:hypothetical protein
VIQKSGISKMNDKEFDNIRKKLFPEAEEKKVEPAPEKISFQDLFKEQEEEGPTKPLAKPEPVSVETAVEEVPDTPEERARLNLKQIKKLISEYRWWLAEAEKRVGDLRAKLVGLETEYRVLKGAAPAARPLPPETPAPAEERAAPAPAPRKKASPARKTNAVWSDADSISVEEAAWRILTEQGKSMPLWRIASAIRRKGFAGEFTESSLGSVVRNSTRLGFTGEGHIYIK